MTTPKYVYILRRLDYDDKVDKEFAILGLDNAKEFTRKKLFEEETWVVTHCNFDDEFVKKKVDEAHAKFDNMNIKLSKADWTWTYWEGGSYSGHWDLVRLPLTQ